MQHGPPPRSFADAAALLQSLVARLELQKQAGTKGRLTVHCFHAEDAGAARALADTVRTRAPWPRNAFEVWLRGP